MADATDTTTDGDSGDSELTTTDGVEDVIESSPLVMLFGDHAKARIIRALLSANRPLNPAAIVDAAGLSARSTWYRNKDDLLATGLVEEKGHAGNSTLYGLAEDDEGDRVDALRRLNDYTGKALRDQDDRIDVEE